MRRISLQSLLGPAFLLYLVSDGASAQGPLDAVGVLVTVLATALTLTPALLLHDPSVRYARAVAQLGLAAGVGLARAAAPAGVSLTSGIAHSVALATAGGLVLHLALRVPDSVQRLRSQKPRRFVELAPLALAVLAGGAGLAAIAPAVRVGGTHWLVPAWWESFPLIFLGASVLTATVLRGLRPALGSTPAALAANTWALLGAAPALVPLLAFAMGVGSSHGTPDPLLRASCAVTAFLLVWGHARALDPDRGLGAGRAARTAVGVALAMLLTISAVFVFEPFLRTRPLPLLAFGALVVSGLLLRPALGFAHALLAPASGRLLKAIELAHDDLARAGDLDAIARNVLAALRAATGELDARPLLITQTPPRTYVLDAAGQAQVEERGLHPELERALRARPSDVLLRAPLEARIVRDPPLRPLVAALTDVDALCVVPIVYEGEVEGALVLPRAHRISQLALEEIVALDGLARHVSGFLAVLAADSRAQQRATEAHLRAQHEIARSDHAHAQASAARAELQALRSLGSPQSFETRPIAYSPTMRTLLDQLERAAAARSSLLLIAERGVTTDALVRPRGDEPWLTCDCGALPLEDGLATLLGTATPAGTEARHGLLELAHRGTLVLRDVCALAPEAQRALAEALRRGETRPLPARPGEDDAASTDTAASEPRRYSCDVRVIGSVRGEPSELIARGALLAELHACFAATLRVPPLRERREDLPSLLLLALDRSSRVLGRPTVGLDPHAHARLLAHGWPGNHAELEDVLERAVLACRGSRVGANELVELLGPDPLARERSEHELDGPLESIEKRALQHALARTAGNKSEAARLLGLKRTTFLDKLRRHKLDERPSARPLDS